MAVNKKRAAAVAAAALVAWESPARCEAEIDKVLCMLSSTALVHMAGFGGRCRVWAREVLLVRGVGPDGDEVGKAAARGAWANG